VLDTLVRYDKALAMSQFRMKEQLLAEHRASVQVLQSAEIYLDQVYDVGVLLINALANRQHIFSCGNGGSASDALHFSAELLNRFECERDPLPCVALNADVATLTAIANDYDYTCVFSKPLRALARPGDVLLAISTSGHSANVLKAVEAADELGITVIAMTGRTGGALSALLKNKKHRVLCVPSDSTARIQEVHGLYIHLLCSMVDQAADVIQKGREAMHLSIKSEN
jgi:phosphoheptose isomerase